MPTVRIPLSGHGHVRLRIEEEGGAFVFLAVAAAAVIAFAHGGTGVDHSSVRPSSPGGITAGGTAGTTAPPDARSTSRGTDCRSVNGSLSTAIDQGALQIAVTNDASRTRSFHVLVTFYAADTGRWLDDGVVVMRAVPAHSQSAAQRLPTPRAEAGLRCRFALSHF
jgi:hypothetical protein